MNITVGQNQMLTKDLYNSIMIGAQGAIEYLPAEDKINLALGLVQAPKIDDATSVHKMAVDLKGKLDDANNLIATLQGQIAGGANNAANPNP